MYYCLQVQVTWDINAEWCTENIGFAPVTADTSVFINGRGIIVAIYVDDINIFSKSVSQINAVKEKLKGFHPMTDSGEVASSLGFDSPGRIIQPNWTRQYTHSRSWMNLG